MRCIAAGLVYASSSNAIDQIIFDAVIFNAQKVESEAIIGPHLKRQRVVWWTLPNDPSRLTGFLSAIID